jgi:hypothetical protein
MVSNRANAIDIARHRVIDQATELLSPVSVADPRRTVARHERGCAAPHHAARRTFSDASNMPLTRDGHTSAVMTLGPVSPSRYGMSGVRRLRPNVQRRLLPSLSQSERRSLLKKIADEKSRVGLWRAHDPSIFQPPPSSGRKRRPGEGSTIQQPGASNWR